MSAARRRELRRRFRQQPMPEVQTRPGARFYVTIRNSSGRGGALLGPYASHMTALANVERGRRLVREAIDDGRINPHDAIEAEFASYGTASVMRTVPSRFGR